MEILSANSKSALQENPFTDGMNIITITTDVGKRDTNGLFAAWWSKINDIRNGSNLQSNQETPTIE